MSELRATPPVRPSGRLAIDEAADAGARPESGAVDLSRVLRLARRCLDVPVALLRSESPGRTSWRFEPDPLPPWIDETTLAALHAAADSADAPRRLRLGAGAPESGISAAGTRLHRPDGADIELWALDRAERAWTAADDEALADLAALMSAMLAAGGALQQLEERERLEERVRKSERRLRMLADALPHMLWGARPEGTIDYCNASTLHYLGLVERGVAFASWLDHLHTADQQRARQSWTAAVHAGGVYRCEVRIRRGVDGMARWHEAYARPIRGTSGKILRWVGSCTDIHDRKQTAERLRQSNQRLSLLSRVTGELLVSEEPRMLLDRLFRELAQQLGLEVYFHYQLAPEAQTLELAAWGGRFDEHRLAQVRTLPLGDGVCGSAAQQRGRVVVEDVQHSDDPRAAWIRQQGVRAYVCHPLISHDRLLGTLAFGSRSEPSFGRHTLALLETICNQVAVALDRSRSAESLRRARDEAEEANRVKGEFLAMMSHELRTPLTGVIGYTEILETEVSGPVNDAQRGQLGGIKSSAYHLLQLIEEILGFARVEAGREELRLAEVDVRGVARAATELIRPLAERRGLEVRLHTPPEPVTLTTDGGKVKQVLLNLLSNAVKFTEEGSVRLDVESLDGEVRLSVEDTGVGIAPEHQDRIFEEFRQIDRPLTRTTGGTGLGLAITRRLTELLGGRIEVRSVPGEGSTFCVHLPRGD